MDGRVTSFIKTNIRLILFGLIILLVLLSISSFLIHRIKVRFEEQEQNRNLDQAKGVLLVITSNAESLSRLLAGWSYWEESIHFINGKKTGYFNNYFTYPVMNEANIDSVIFFNLQGQYVNSRRITTNRKAIEEFPPETTRKIEKALHNLIPENIDGFKWGLLETDQGVIILTCRHISDDSISKPSQGYILFGRLLNNKELIKISDIFDNSISWKAEKNPQTKPEGIVDIPAFGSLVINRTHTRTQKKDPHSHYIEINLQDILKNESLHLCISIPKSYSTQAQVTASFINTINLITFLIISGFVSYLIVEIYRRHRAEENLRESLRFERCISQLSQLFINLPENKLDQAINEALAILAEFISSDLGFIFEFTDDYKHIKKTHHWHSKRYTPQIGFNESVPTQGLESFITKINEDEVVVLNLKNEISPTSGLAAYIYHKLHITSSLNAPMKEGNLLIGFIGFASLDPDHSWAEEEKRLLSTFAKMLTLFIQRKKAAIKIQESQKSLIDSALKNSELKSLKDQINPHFLFNSLNSLRALIDESPDNARRAVTLLSNLLRASLRAGQAELIRLDEEMIVVNAFLALEHIRFEERLRSIILIPEECSAYLIPPMLVQTLVENAVKYGVEPYSQGGIVCIKAKTEGKYLHLTVENSGQLSSSSDSIQIGLANAQDRIRLLFSNNGQLKIHNSSSTTVTAEIIIPIVYECSPR